MTVPLWQQNTATLVQGFTIPNEAAATYGVQSDVDSRDLAIITAGFQLTGVVAGCAVAAQPTPDGTVQVGAGIVVIGGIQYSVTAGNVTVIPPSADATNARVDLITISRQGTKGIVNGVAAAIPVFPTTTPTDRVVIAAVLVPATATTITAGQIVDKRVIFGDQRPGHWSVARWSTD